MLEEMMEDIQAPHAEGKDDKLESNANDANNQDEMFFDF